MQPLKVKASILSIVGLSSTYRSSVQFSKVKLPILLRVVDITMLVMSDSANALSPSSITSASSMVSGMRISVSVPIYLVMRIFPFSRTEYSKSVFGWESFVRLLRRCFEDPMCRKYPHCHSRRAVLSVQSTAKVSL